VQPNLELGAVLIEFRSLSAMDIVLAHRDNTAEYYMYPECLSSFFEGAQLEIIGRKAGESKYSPTCLRQYAC
jgi:hypothetical protein